MRRENKEIEQKLYDWNLKQEFHEKFCFRVAMAEYAYAPEITESLKLIKDYHLGLISREELLDGVASGYGFAGYEFPCLADAINVVAANVAEAKSFSASCIHMGKHSNIEEIFDNLIKEMYNKLELKLMGAI